MSDDADAKPEDDVAAETEVEAEPQPEPEAPKGLKGKLMAMLAGKLKLIIVAVAVLAVVGGGGAGLYFSGLLHVDKPHEAVVMLPDPPVFHEMPRITVDLAPSAKHARPFIRVTMQAELQGESARTAYIANETKILDAIQSHLRQTTVEDLQGEQGTERLREDITIIINRMIAPEIAIGVLYKDILIR